MAAGLRPPARNTERRPQHAAAPGRGKGILLAAFLALVGVRPALALPSATSAGAAAARIGGRPALVFTNDGFGPGPVLEWDDLDSYGISLVLPLPAGLRLDAGLSGLTERVASPGEGVRTDRLDMSIALEPALPDVGPLEPRLSCFGGLLATGNFGGLAVQEGWHSEVGVGRPVPEAYAADARASAFGGLCLGISLEVLPGLSALSRAGAEASFPGFWTAGFSGGLEAVSGQGRLALEAGWTASGISATTVLAGPLVLPDSGKPRRGDFRVAYGLRSGSAPAPFMRVEVDLARPKPWLSWAAFAELGNGWMGAEATGEAAPRFSEYGLGVLARLDWLPLPLEANAGAGFRLCYENLRSLDEGPSALLASRALVALDLECGARLGLAPERAGLPRLGASLRVSPLSLVTSSAGPAFEKGAALSLRFFLVGSN